jgi:hypothetical protein
MNKKKFTISLVLIAFTSLTVVAGPTTEIIPIEFELDGDATALTNSSFACTIELWSHEHKKKLEKEFTANTLPYIYGTIREIYHGGSAGAGANIEAPVLTPDTKKTVFEGKLVFLSTVAAKPIHEGEKEGFGTINTSLKLGGRTYKTDLTVEDLKASFNSFGDDLGFSCNEWKEHKTESIESYELNQTQYVESIFNLEAGFDASVSAGEAGLLISASPTGYAKYSWSVKDYIDPTRSFSGGAVIEHGIFSATGCLNGLPWIINQNANGWIDATLNPLYSPGGIYEWNTGLTDFDWEMTKSISDFDHVIIPEPASLTMVLIGLGSTSWWLRRRKELQASQE